MQTLKFGQLIVLALIIGVLTSSFMNVANTQANQLDVSSFSTKTNDVFQNESLSVSNGFDFPVGQPDGTGWRANHNGLWFLDRYDYGGNCGLTYHPAHDFNRDGSTGDRDRYEPVYAASSGIVRASTYDGTSTWGNIIVIEHSLPDGTTVWTQYGHLENRMVNVGDTVTKRQQIGRVGKGSTNYPVPAHLHFEVRKVNLSATAFPCGQSQQYVIDRYYNPITFIDQHRNLQTACNYSIGQGTSGSELTAFNNAYSTGGGQIALGCPTASVRFDGFTSANGTTGHYQTFEKGEILYHVNNSLAGRAFAIEDPLRGKWASYPFNNLHPLGYPTSSISQQTSSCFGTQNRYQSFERGSLSQHSGNVYEVHGAIHTKWQAKGFAGCPLGLPTIDESPAQPSGATGSTGKLNQFQGGQIYWKTGAAEAYETHGWIKDTYVQMGGSASWLGFPISDEFYDPTTGQPRSNFEGGYITWDGARFSAFHNQTQCSYSISPSSQSFPSNGGNGTINVTTSAGCNRTGTSNVSWITVTSGGTGSGTVSYSVASNSGQARTGTITIGGQTFTVTQSAAASTACSTTISFGQTCNGTLQNGDRLFTDSRFFDAYTFSGTAGQKIYITLNSTQFDTYLYLIKGSFPGGSTWASDDDGGGVLNSRIPAYSGVVTLSSTGTYTILATSYWANKTGNYTLNLGKDSLQTTFIRKSSPYDFDSDEKTDYSIFRPSNGTWYFQSSAKSGFNTIQFGISTDKIVPADYDGDGRTDIAVFRNGVWHLLQSTDGNASVQFGMTGDIPQPADYDGDGKADIAVFRPSNGVWYLQRSSQGFTGIQFGQNGDKPVAADYDGDGKTDVAVVRQTGGVSNWYILGSTQGFYGLQFGTGTDIPVPADYDGDTKADVAVYRNGIWYLLRSRLGFTGVQFGAATDKPTVGDYDGDGKADTAIWRQSDGTFYVLQSQDGVKATTFGQNTDIPVASAYVP